MPKRRRPGLDEREQQAWRSYLLAHARLTAELNRRLLSRSGLSIGDYEVLVHLADAPEARLRVSELAAAMRWERSRLSHHLSRMQGRGLVRREDCETDARGAFVVLADDGRIALALAAPGHVDDVRELFVDPVGAALEAVDRSSRRMIGAVDAGNS